MAVLALQDAEYLWKCVFVYASGVSRGMNDSSAIRERIPAPTAGVQARRKRRLSPTAYGAL